MDVNLLSVCPESCLRARVACLPTSASPLLGRPEGGEKKNRGVAVKESRGVGKRSVFLGGLWKCLPRCTPQGDTNESSNQERVWGEGEHEREGGREGRRESSWTVRRASFVCLCAT